MRRFADATTTRAAGRSRVARTRRAHRMEAVRLRLGLDRPIGLTGVCGIVLLVFGSALFLEHLAPFTLQLRGLLGWPQQQATFTDTGEILFMPVLGNSCRKVLFFNRTGQFGPDQQVRCDTGLPPDHGVVVLRDVRPSERIHSIRQAFTSHMTR